MLMYPSKSLLDSAMLIMNPQNDVLRALMPAVVWHRSDDEVRINGQLRKLPPFAVMRDDQCLKLSSQSTDIDKLIAMEVCT